MLCGSSIRQSRSSAMFSECSLCRAFRKLQHETLSLHAWSVVERFSLRCVWCTTRVTLHRSLAALISTFASTGTLKTSAGGSAFGCAGQFVVYWKKRPLVLLMMNEFISFAVNWSDFCDVYWLAWWSCNGEWPCLCLTAIVDLQPCSTSVMAYGLLYWVFAVSGSVSVMIRFGHSVWRRQETSHPWAVMGQNMLGSLFSSGL